MKQLARLGNAPCAATRVDTASLSAEDHQVLGVAGAAAHAQETVRQVAALEVGL